VTDPALNLLNSLLTLNPNDRITAREAMEHDYFFDAKEVMS